MFRIVDLLPGCESPMHRTNSIDYGIVLEGEIELELEDLAPWRVAFILIGLPGLLALMLVPLLHSPPPAPAAASGADGQLLPFMRANTGDLTLFLLTAGCSAIATGVITAWVPEYLIRVLGASPAEAGSALGLILLAAAFAGQGSLAMVIDWMAARGVVDAPLRAALVPVALAVPLGWLAFSATSTAGFYPLLFALALCTSSLNAAHNTVAQTIAPPALRARVGALFIFSINVLGFAIGPALVGALSEYVLGEAELGVAMRLVTVTSMALTLAVAWQARKALAGRMAAQSQPTS